MNLPPIGQAPATTCFPLSLGVFILGLVASGVTAFPLLIEMKVLVQLLNLGGATSPEGHTGLAFWILTVRFGLEETYRHYPWLLTGRTGWLLGT